MADRFSEEDRLEVWCALRADGEMGHGTARCPYDLSGPTLCGDRFKSFKPNSVIHLGPGIFQTFGADSFQVKAGQRIVGTGMFNTTIKIVGITRTNGVSFAFGNSPFEPYGNVISGVEISDLSVDCNMRGHLGQAVATGAIALYGSRTRIRRVRAFDFASAAVDGAGNLIECFVISIGGAHAYFPEPTDCLIEDCLIHRPSKNGWYTTSCLIFGAGEVADYGAAYHRRCTMRHNVIDCQYQDRPVSVSAITFSTTTGVATATTKTPHHRTFGEWIILSGALENSQPSAHFNGSFQITGVPSGTTVEFTYFHSSVTGYTTVFEPTGEMWIGRYSSQVVGIKHAPSDVDPYNPDRQGVTSTGPEGGPWTIDIATDKPHFRVPGDYVAPSAILVDGDPSPILNGLFRVTEIVNPARLRYIVTEDPGEPNVNPDPGADISIGYNGLSADAGAAAVARNNRIYNTDAGFYHDSYGTGDLAVRKNHFHAVQAGIFKNFSQSIGTPRGLESLSSSGQIATLTTSARHYLKVGQAVFIAGAGVPYDGAFEIKSVPTPTTLTYEMASVPTEGPHAEAQVQSLWQMGWQVHEQNIIDLILSPLKSGWGSPYGIVLGGGLFAEPYRFPQIIVRGNFLRSPGDVFDPDSNVNGIGVSSCLNLIIEANTINKIPIYRVTHAVCRAVKYFNNRDAAGKLIQGGLSPSSLSNELTTDADLALLLSI